MPELAYAKATIGSGCFEILQMTFADNFMTNS